MKRYFAKITRQSDRKYLVEFPELEGCLTEGNSLEEALKHAKEALDGYLAGHCDRDLDIPGPRIHKGRSFYAIAVDVKIAFAIRLRELRMKKKMTQSEVAKRLGISQQAYAKLETPQSNPSLETMKRVSEALGAKIDLKLVS